MAELVSIFSKLQDCADHHSLSAVPQLSTQSVNSSNIIRSSQMCDINCLAKDGEGSYHSLHVKLTAVQFIVHACFKTAAVLEDLPPNP